MFFRNSEESHVHSLETLNWLYEHDDFMMSIGTMLDIGCGTGLDLEWWATRTTRDDVPAPLDIRCTGLDLVDTPQAAKKYPNVTYQRNDFEKQIHTSKNKKYDVLWCHDSFQYALNPLATLKLWHSIAAPNAMLVLILPQTTNIDYRKLSFIQPSGCYYHYTLVNLMHMLAVSGWDCNAGFFKKSATDPWLHAVVYKSDQDPMDLGTSWYSLADTGLLPKTAVESINRHGFVNQNDLVLPWLDKNLTWYGQQ
jgi:SAM-dependent methyltransferase